MGATSFSIGDVSYDALSSADGKRALGIKVGAYQQRILKFHPPGTNGNLLILDGTTGCKIVARVRYIGDRDTILAAWETDRNSWVDTVFDVTDDVGTTYERCILESAEMIGDKQTGKSGTDNGFFDAMIVVSSEA